MHGKNLTTKQRFGKSQKGSVTKFVCELESVCKPDSVIGSHLSWTRVTSSLWRPTRRLSLRGGERVTPRPNGPSLLLGLAPSGGCLATPVARCAGGLLHHLFTLAWSCGPSAVCFCGPIPELPRPGVTRRCTLWSPDFPRPGDTGVPQSATT